MSTERVTENFVRKHFEKHSSKIKIEEQKSTNPKIDKLLKNASKKGTGDGKPEFIVTFNDNPNFIIVVECKRDITKHKSKTGDRYDDYAVDGVLLYSAFLSKEFDVLAIAVSGLHSRELKISHFLQLKGQAPIDKFSNKLLDIDSYLNGYISSPEKLRVDYNSLLSFSRELNEELHSYKVKESSRSLLISGILIALGNDAFKSSFSKHKKPDGLANALVEAILYELKSANIHNKKLENLKTAYSFIRTHAALSNEKGVLVKLIDDIDTNINTFFKTHKFIDVLGQFYIQFLRYANSDSGLGIVLTPPHITELFSDLAEVNKDSIVLDNCTGTGGFLISAMSKMIKDAADDDKKIKAIKAKQLVGIEYQDDIFALACSNMIIHDDGKTNMIYGSCFDDNVIKAVKKNKPTVGFLNPPYKTKKSDKEELEFILNNLEMLQRNATCVAIVPISCVLANSGEAYELKAKLLEDHTLEAVMSMPDELFHDSDVGVVTCIIVVTAHVPHKTGKSTWFGYWKNDGFVKTKKGRLDVGNWEGIKKDWLHDFVNRKEVDGKSVLKAVSATDEWCAESYMVTDYSTLTDDDFIKTVRNYAMFKMEYEGSHRTI